MLTYDTTITVCNSIYNKDTGFYDYSTAIVKNCSWYGEIKTSTSENGLLYSKFFKVRILGGVSLADKELVNPSEYNNPTEQYTIQNGTFIALGEHATPIDHKGYEELTKLDKSFLVLNVHDNRRIALKHILIEGS